MRLNKKTKKYFFIPLLYVLLAVIFTYPLAQNLNTHFPAYGKGGDAHSFIWNSWNFIKTLEAAPINPLTTTALLFPFQPNLAFHTYTLLRNALVFLFSIILPFAASFNLVTLLMFVLSGFGAYLLTMRFTRSHIAAFISGVIFSFCPFKLARLMAHYNFVDAAFIPFYILFLFRTFDRKSYRDPILAGVFLALIGYCSYYYLIFTFAFTGIFVFYSFFSRSLIRRAREKAAERTSVRLQKYFLNFAVLGLVFVILFSPILVNILKYQNDYFVTKKAFGESPELTQLVTPSPTSLLNRYLFKGPRYGTEKVIFLGFTVILLALFSFTLVRKKPYLLFWHLNALIFIIFSLGSYMIIGGKKILWLPYQVIHTLPILSAARNPSRYIIFAMLALGILSACSIENIIRRVNLFKRQKFLSLGIPFLILILISSEYLTIPLRLFDMKPHDYYARIAEDEARYSLLEIPFAVSGKGKSFGSKERQGLYQFYQTIHNKDLPTGWLAHLPDKIFSYYSRLDFIQNICYLQENTGTVPEATWQRLIQPDAQFKVYLNVFNIRYILIHRGAVKETQIDNLERYFTSQLSGFADFTIRKRNNIIRYTLMEDVLDPMPGQNLLSTENELALTEGWSNLTNYQGKSGRWTITNQARLLFASPRKKEYSLALDLEAPPFSLQKNQTLKIKLNNKKISQFSFSGHSQKNIILPMNIVEIGANTVSLLFSSMTPVRIENNESYLIGSTGVLSPVDIQAVSFSKRLPFEGRIMFTGIKTGRKNQKLSLKRGYNILVIDEKSGIQIEQQVFGTNTSHQQADKMAEFIRDIPRGRIVIALTWDDASINLNENAVSALLSIGAQSDLRENPRSCHAIIGVKGAQPGSALEKVDPFQAALNLGSFSNAEKVGAWFNSIKIYEK